MEQLSTTLATEIMHELKQSSKRWFIAFIFMCFVEVATILGFVWYISLPVEESTSVEQKADDIDGNNFKQIIGDDY